MPHDAGSLLAVHVSPSAARVPGLVEGLSAASGHVSVARDGVELPWLELHDDAKAAAVYSAQRPGVSVSGAADRLELVGRLADWAHGGEAPNPPPLTAIRIASFEGLEPVQLAAMVSLAVEVLVVEQQEPGAPPANAPRLKTALEPASAVENDRRANPDCRAPCRPWPWQTVWSVLTISARAKWQLGARLKDAALLAQSAELARRALNVIPEQTHSLTIAVSQRLLGAVLHNVGDLNDDDAVLARSLTASERALSAFRADRYRYDWALTQANIQRTLSSRAERSASPGAVAAALAASDGVLSVFDQRTPNLRARALLERARLLQGRWGRSGDQRDLSEAVRLAQQAAGTGATVETLVIAVALRRCELESELASGRDDVQGLKQAVAQCEHLLNRPSLPDTSAPEAHRSYGLALARLAMEVGDAAMIGLALEQLERAIEGADRIEGKRAGIKAQADYVWGLIQLSRLTSSIEAARKATSVITKVLEPISKETAPLAWGEIKQLQGNALMGLGLQLRGAFQMAAAAELYEQARAAFVEALGSFAKDENPKRWATLQGRIGATFAWQGEIGERQQRYLLNQAIASYQRALTVVRRQDDLEALGQAQLGLGSAYLIWADQAPSRTTVRDPAQRAAAAFRTALDAFQQAGNVKSVANAKAHLADTLDILQRVARAPACEAITLRVEAVAAYPRAHGLWEPAQEALDRYHRAPLDRQRCP